MATCGTLGIPEEANVQHLHVGLSEDWGVA